MSEPHGAGLFSDDHGLIEANPLESAKLVNRAFGEENRARLLTDYFSGTGEIKPETAWIHVYRLLLSIDRTIGLAHCYESDKCQPGRPWYARSLAFHKWLSDAMGVEPGDLGSDIDWLFKKASADLAGLALRAGHSERVRQQRRPYEGQAFPEPGDDPELMSIILNGLAPWMQSTPPAAAQRELSERIMAYLTQENKRKNLIGEGFEDTLAAILRRVPGISDTYTIHTRAMLHHLPGFHRGPVNEKPRQVDLALVRKSDQQRTLITAKWSVRADREEQFMSDFRDYARVNFGGEAFRYVLVTNEFDAARLVRACDRRAENTLLLTDVVHVNTSGPKVAYADVSPRSKNKCIEMLRHIETGRLSSLERWLQSLASGH
ncbi:hypothetical protein [Micromonospora hortensis]|uniref:hypothetical protein n=1 Tax=Micromonospora hortensis TaxID=2911209 RepID=UPI001EE944C8|nr:hypothetical protein [Micromonospora hortensis]MCG5450781.1 hypothetical protein [Micromonospora hortensis]